MERKTYVIGLLFSTLSQLLFFFCMYYHTDETGRSWILFHPEHWKLALALSVIGVFFIVLGIIADIMGVDGIEMRRKEKMVPPQETPSRIQKPQKPKERKEKTGSMQLDDLEAEDFREEPVEAPKIWEEEEFE